MLFTNRPLGRANVLKKNYLTWSVVNNCKVIQLEKLKNLKYRFRLNISTLFSIMPVIFTVHYEKLL